MRRQTAEIRSVSRFEIFILRKKSGDEEEIASRAALSIFFIKAFKEK